MSEAKSTIWLMSLQCELSMRIGTSLDADDMLRDFLVVLCQRLQLRAAQIWWLRPDGSLAWHAYPAWSCRTWRQDAERATYCEAFVRADQPQTSCLVCSDGFCLNALRIEQVGALFLEARAGAMRPEAMAVVQGLMPRLALAIRACAEHQNGRALLALSQQQNRELEQAREIAEQAWRNKSEFLAAISHEMRTPLNSILGFADLLQLELGDGELADYARSILSSGRHLHAMFNDLLDLARLDARRLQLHPEDVSLTQLCTDLWAPFAAALLAKGLTGALRFEGDVPARIVVDPVRLRQILNNLLANAVKYTQQGRVELLVSTADGMLTFAVIDTGPGIAPEQHALVFERFRQLGGGGRYSEGAGLGLAISRELAENMGGFILLESASGDGAVFTLHIPPVDPQLS